MTEDTDPGAGAPNPEPKPVRVTVTRGEPRVRTIHVTGYERRPLIPPVEIVEEEPAEPKSGPPIQLGEARRRRARASSAPDPQRASKRLRALDARVNALLDAENDDPAALLAAGAAALERLRPLLRRDTPDSRRLATLLLTMEVSVEAGKEVRDD